MSDVKVNPILKFTAEYPGVVQQGLEISGHSVTAADYASGPEPKGFKRLRSTGARFRDFIRSVFG